MIRNIIFDMGNVLIRYDPEYFIGRAGIKDPQEKALLLSEIYRSPKWALMDYGQWTEKDLEAYVLPRLPVHLHKVVPGLISHWEPLEPIPGMAELICDCKKSGLGIYLLSNASFRQPDYWKDIPGHEYFDGTIVSAFEGCVKPSAEIFHRLLERFHLKAEECFFVDDMAENVASAKRVGIDGFVFQGDAAALRKAISALTTL